MAADNNPTGDGDETADSEDNNLPTLINTGRLRRQFVQTRFGWETASLKLPVPESLRFVTM